MYGPLSGQVGRGMWGGWSCVGGYFLDLESVFPPTLPELVPAVAVAGTFGFPTKPAEGVTVFSGAREDGAGAAGEAEAEVGGACALAAAAAAASATAFLCSSHSFKPSAIAACSLTLSPAMAWFWAEPALPVVVVVAADGREFMNCLMACSLKPVNVSALWPVTRLTYFGSQPARTSACTSPKLALEQASSRGVRPSLASILGLATQKWRAAEVSRRHTLNTKAGFKPTHLYDQSSIE
jgi:hypothetical protein